MVTYVTPFPCILADDFGRTNEDTVLFLNILANDQGTGLRLQKVGGGTAAIGDVIARIQTTFGLVQLKLGANNQVVFDPGDMFDSLRLGQSTTFQGVYRVSDVAGTSATANITIRVDGLNDGPRFSILNGRATFTEAINASAQNLPAVQGSLVVNDADIGNTLDAKIVGTPTLTYSAGALPVGNNLSALTSLSALKLTDGVSNGGTRSLAWTYDPTAVNLDFLRPGEILTIRYGVAVSDGLSQAATQNLVFTIRGTNDAPIIKSGDPAFDVTGALTETNAALSTTGRVVFTDLDRADTPAATVNTSAAVVTATGIALTAAQVAAFKAGFAITNPGTGAWSYNISAAATQFLGLNDQVKIVYNVVVTDDFGASKTQPVTITIRGTNDGLVLGPAPAQAGFTEAIDASAQNLPAVQRSLLVTDADSGDALTAHIVGTPTLTYSGVTLPPGAILSALINTGALTLGSAVSSGGQRSITATYDPAAVNLDFLRPGETLAIKFGIALTDGHTTTPTRFLTVNITGTNDAPIIQTGDVAFDVAGTLAETNSALSTTGRVVFTDLDRADTPAATVDTAAATVTTNGIVLTQAQINAFKAGFAITNAGTGTWAYNLAAAHSQFLDTGEQVQIVYSVVVTDDFGASVTQPVTITINGTNDGPVAVNDSYATGEDTPLTVAAATGLLANDSDVDGEDIDVTNISGLTVANNPAGIIINNLGTLTINPETGALTYTPSADFQGLDTGEFVDLTFTYQATDGTGSSNTATVTIRVNGANDGPTAVNDSRTVNEDVLLNATSVLTNDIDVDGDDLDVVRVGGSTIADGGVGDLDGVANGSIRFNTTAGGTAIINLENGTFSYNQNGLFSGLDTGETGSDSFQYIANDGTANSNIATVNITITGANDTPTVTVDPGNPQGANDVVSEAGLVNGSAAASNSEFAGGTFTLSDTDGLDDIASVTINGNTVLIANLNGSSFTGAHGTLTVTAYNAVTGVATYQYELTSPTTDLAGIESDVFAVTVSDGTNTSAPANITIEIADDISNAVNDTNSVAEDAVAPIGGNVLTNDLHPNGQPGADTPRSFVSWNGSTTGTYGTFVANPDGTYSYTLNNGNALVQGLDNGQSLTETFNYTMQDADGDTDTATLTITITGANDTPTVTVDPGNPQGANDVVSEAGLANGSAAASNSEFAGGTFTLSDTDGLDDIASVTINGNTVLIANLNGSSFTGAHGTLTVTAYNAVTGVATYQYELTSPTTDLAGIESDVFAVTVSDGTNTSAPANITIEIADDISNAVNDTNSVAEDAVAPIGGNVLTNDLHPNGQPGADTPRSFVSWNGSTTGTYGTFVANPDGTYSYTLNNGNALVQGLDNGQSLTETFNYTMQDADGDTDTATLTITITGANDTPTVTVDPGNPQGANDVVSEAGLVNGSAAASNSEFAGGTFTLSDTDGLDDIASVTINGNTVLIANLNGSSFTGAHGTLTVTAYNAVTGVATYQYELTSPTTDLAGIESDVFAVTVSDGTNTSAPANITIEIADDISNAVNDTNSVAEDAVAPIGGNVLTNDLHPNGQPGADTPRSFVSWNGSTTGTYGTFVANPDGTYSYTLNNGNALVQGLDNGQSLTETFNYTMQDADGDTDTATLTITINGANDAPVVQPNKSVWVPSDPAQQSPGFVDGYPLAITAPTDVDGEPLTITVTDLPAAGEVRYFNGVSFVPLTLNQVITSELTSLVYVPSADNDDTLTDTFTYSVNDGTAPPVLQTVTINEVPPNRLPGATSQIGGGSSPLTSGNDQIANLTLTQTFVDGLNPAAAFIRVSTDFQDNPNDVPVPVGERNPGAFGDGSTGSHREQEVQTEVLIDGNRFVVVEDDLTAPTFEQSWFFNATTGLMEATVSYNNIFLLDAGGNATATTLAQYLTANPAAAGDIWTVSYFDNDGGQWQARQANFDFFFNDPGDPGIVVNGIAGSDLAYGTSGVDNLQGNAGDDTLVGRADNDIIVGGAGNDNLTGGADNDIFRFVLTTDGVDHITDFDAGTNATAVDRLQFDVGLANFSVGDNDTVVENFQIGNSAAVNVAGTEVGVNTTPVATANIQSTIDGYTNITTGGLFVFLDITKGHAVVYHDPNPSVLGGAVLVAELDNITTAPQLLNLNSTDWNFI